MADIKVLRAALDAIERYPDHHDQAAWCQAYDRASGKYGEAEFPVAKSNGEHPPCGTTLCMAGWIAFQNAPAGSRMTQNDDLVVLPGRESDPAYYGEYIPDYARDLAGLTQGQDDALFHGAKSLGDLAAMVDLIEQDADISKRELQEQVLGYDD